MHFVRRSTRSLLFGAAPAAFGLALGLLLQGVLFVPTDLPQYGMNATTLLVPLFASRALAKRLIPSKAAYRAVASERTRTTEFDLLVRDAAKANCRNDVDEWRDAVSAAAWSQSIGGGVGHQGRLALLINGNSSVERGYPCNISSLLITAAMARRSAASHALLQSAGMFAVRQRRSPCMD